VPARQAGFTLVELLLVLLVSVLLLVAVLDLFDGINRLARVQTHLSELQQSQRVAQDELVRRVRMAGRGGLAGEPRSTSVADLAPVAVRNNVGLGGGDRRVVAGEAAQAVEGSDVLVLRGVFSTPVYRVDYVDAGAFDPANRRLVVRDVTPTGIPQDLEPLREAIRGERPEALVLTDALGDLYGVAELDPAASSAAAADRVVLVYRTAGTARAVRYAALSSAGAFPALAKVLSVGLLEEHRFYVTAGDPAPRLARARTYPASEEVWGGELGEPVAENVLDLQVALGFDSPLAGGFFACDDDTLGDDDRVVETAAGDADDWLFNRAAGDGEDAAEVPWSPPVGGWTAVVTGCGDTPRPELYYVRVATLVRSPRPDPKFRAPVLDRLADRVYGLAADDRVNGEGELLHRRRILETTVDLRNL
jgi:prepilin-type N-terminal cleavage/methylation domain-containing protein